MHATKRQHRRVGTKVRRAQHHDRAHVRRALLQGRARDQAAHAVRDQMNFARPHAGEFGLQGCAELAQIQTPIEGKIIRVEALSFQRQLHPDVDDRKWIERDDLLR